MPTALLPDDPDRNFKANGLPKRVSSASDTTPIALAPITYDTSRPSIICSAAELVRDFEVLSVTGRAMGYMLPVFVLHNFQPRRPCSQISDDEGARTANTLRIGIISENRLLNQPLLPSRPFFVSLGHRDSVYATGFATAMASCNVVVMPTALGPSEKFLFEGIWLAFELRPDLLPSPSPQVEIDDPFQYWVLPPGESLQVQVHVVTLAIIPRIVRDGCPNRFVEIVKIALPAFAKPPAAGANVLRLPFRASLDLPGGVAADIVSIFPPETVDCISGHFTNGPQIAHDSLRETAQSPVNRSYTAVNPLEVDRFTGRVVIFDANRR